MPAPKGNKNAEKPEEEKATSFLHIKCTKAEKALWVQASYPDKLSKWVKDTLTRAAMSD